MGCLYIFHGSSTTILKIVCVWIHVMHMQCSALTCNTYVVLNLLCVCYGYLAAMSNALDCHQPTELEITFTTLNSAIELQGVKG